MAAPAAVLLREKQAAQVTRLTQVPRKATMAAMVLLMPYLMQLAAVAAQAQ
jgi:hypothetical protein